MSPHYYSPAHVADILSISKETLKRWEKNGTLVPEYSSDNCPRYHKSQLESFDSAKQLFDSNWDKEIKVSPIRAYKSLELFAGGGGLAIGMEKAGFEPVLLNEFDKHACETLKLNRPNWNVVCGDVTELDFTQYKDKIDILSGGFPCQAFSSAGKRLGFKDIRGTLFFQYARAAKETNAKVLVAENVRGLLNHDDGKTLQTIVNVIDEIGYKIVDPQLLKAIFYQVPQKRERLFLVAIRKDLADLVEFNWPSPYFRIMTMRDALKAGELYSSDVPDSIGQKYPKRKAEIMKEVPQGGYWKDLPDNLQREYMKASYFLGGGKTGIAKRLSWDEPSLTLMCSPAQKQTDRCHPEEERPLTVREYARVQTFPDSWKFAGPMTAQYKQIGNAVPVNLAYAVGRSLIRLLNDIETIKK